MKIINFVQQKFLLLLKTSILVNILELTPVLFLTSFMTAPYMDFRPLYYPVGYEFHVSTVSHYLWTYLPECGNCVLWNGTVNGGMPAFGELLGAVLHPLVIATTLVWGVIDGTKVLLFLSLLMSGFAIWWFAKELGVSRFSRIWISLFGVVGGHIIGRLESGNIILVLSTASACLVYPMILRLNKKPSFRRVAGLAIILALAWLSGQGYNQLGVVLAWFPAAIWLLYESGKKKQEKWIAFGSAIVISALLCAVLLVPALRFWGNIEKFTMDDFKNLQPMRYVLLNLVINEHELFRQTYLGMDTFPYARINFIGWIPVILATLSGYFVMKKKKKTIFFALYLSIFLILIFTSRDIYPILKDYLPFVNNLRAFSVATSLLVPPILVLAAWCLDRLFELKWPVIAFNKKHTGDGMKGFSVKWLILIPLVIVSFKNVIPTAKNYIHVIKVDIPQSELNFARLNDTQWVNPPNYEWFPVLMSEKRKLIMTDRFFTWKDRYRLYGYIDLTNNPNNDPIEGRISRQPNFDVIMRPEEIYASVDMDGERMPCKAISRGGNIDVWCDNPVDGILTVREYMYSGWNVWMDGEKQSLQGGDWLTVDAPKGKHTYSFRFYPLDVYIGAAISLVGLVIAILLLFIKDKTPADIA